MRTVPGSLKVLATPLLTLVLALSACSGDDDPDEPAESGAPATSSLETTANVAEITGRLSKKQRGRVVDEVTEVIDGWWDAAYLTVDAKDPFPGFTAGAARLAGRQAEIMTNAAFVDGVDSLEATRRVVTLDVLAARRKAAGVTAKVLLVLETDGATSRRVTVRGTVELSPGRDGWRIFGYRMSATPKETR